MVGRCYHLEVGIILSYFKDYFQLLNKRNEFIFLIFLKYRCKVDDLLLVKTTNLLVLMRKLLLIRIQLSSWIDYVI